MEGSTEASQSENTQTNEYAQEAFSVLGMYPFQPLQQAWDHLYWKVTRILLEDYNLAAPLSLKWDINPSDSWSDERLVLGMSCGFPVSTTLRDKVRVIGTFSFTPSFGSKTPFLYRSVIIARKSLSVPLEQVCSEMSLRAAVNSYDSLSGYISLLSACGFKYSSGWPQAEVVLTGAHVNSYVAVRDGAADIASVDGMTWEYLQRISPSLLDGVVVVGYGPYVPCLPLILKGDATDAEVSAWRNAFQKAIKDPSLTESLAKLMLQDFVVLENDDYYTLLDGLGITCGISKLNNK